MEAFGDRVLPVHVDMTDEASIKAAAKTASDAEVVVNNAGVLTTTDALDADVLKSLEYEFDVNVYGLVRVAKALFDAVEEGSFHVWPDTMAREIGSAYQSFAENVVESDMSESVT